MFSCVFVHIIQEQNMINALCMYVHASYTNFYAPMYITRDKHTHLYIRRPYYARTHTTSILLMGSISMKTSKIEIMTPSSRTYAQISKQLISLTLD